jgi:predicted amidohydrolase YtcJ
MVPSPLATPPPPSPELALVGADVLTLDNDRPRATAVLVRDGEIVLVGDDAAVRAAASPAAETVDLGGACLVPGLVDGHLHALSGHLMAPGADLLGALDRDTVRAALRAERARVGPEGVVRAFGVDYEVYGGHDLDGRDLEADAEGPALIAFFDLHTHLATPSVLALAGVDGPVAFADGSEIVVRDGRPTGELRERAAYEHVVGRLPAAAESNPTAGAVATQRRMNAVGLSGGHVMDGTPETFDQLRRMEAAGELTTRLVVPLLVEPTTSDQEQEAWLRLRDERGRLWRGGVAKFFADGVVESGTAWLAAPDTRGGGTASFWPDPERLRAAIVRFARAGFQCVTHAVGDGAVAFVLDAYREGGAAAGVVHRVEHAETLPDHLLERFAAEGIACSVQPLHGQWRAPDRTDEWTLRLGPERAADAWRTADQLRSGALVPLGSDWPVAQLDPRLGLHYAIARRMPGRGPEHVLDPEQALDPLDALRGYTVATAAVVGAQDRLGRIAPGFHADLTAFAADPTAVALDALAELPVRLVVVDGRIVHRTES